MFGLNGLISSCEESQSGYGSRQWTDAHVLSLNYVVDVKLDSMTNKEIYRISIL